MEQDHYIVLGLTPAADAVEIRAAYRTLMRRFHPDADGSDESAEQARVINEAHAVLGDPAKRAAYDRSRASKGALRFDPIVRRTTAGRKRSWLGPGAAIIFASLAVGMLIYAMLPKNERIAPGFVFNATPDPSATSQRHTAVAAEAQSETNSTANLRAVASEKGAPTAHAIPAGRDPAPRPQPAPDSGQKASNTPVQVVAQPDVAAGRPIDLWRREFGFARSAADAALQPIVDRGGREKAICSGGYAAAIQRSPGRLRIFKLPDDRLCEPPEGNQRHHGWTGSALRRRFRGKVGRKCQTIAKRRARNSGE